MQYFYNMNILWVVWKICVYAHTCVCVCTCTCVCVCEGGGRVILVRHLCVLHVGFRCLELWVFLFECLLYAPWAQLRRGARRPHYHYYYMVADHGWQRGGVGHRPHREPGGLHGKNVSSPDPADQGKRQPGGGEPVVGRDGVRFLLQGARCSATDMITLEGSRPYRFYAHGV